MAFHGLFVGIDRYRSRGISWLTCARRDAVALHALFTDTLGGDADLLTDGAATREAIAHAFARLAISAPDDVVVVAFSGHGTPTHELVTYDADPDALTATSIALDTLCGWFACIPASRLVCILDCCFSGGMGAKVLQVEARPRSLASADALLQQLSGEGRLILTAAAADEEAHEHARLGHGLLTYYLLEALQGADEVRVAGKVSVYRLLDYVTQRVTAAAAVGATPQHPTLRGSLDGAWTWPVFTPGALYHAAFPERGQAPVSADLQSLAAQGFPQPLLQAWAGTIPGLNQLQIDAINDFHLLRGDHLVVSAPTSSGKTMIGELAALKGALQRKRALFLLPLKALVGDKHQQFVRTYGPFGLTAIRATGDIDADLPALMRGQYDICLMTYEKCAALVLGQPHLLDGVGTIVVDEVQMIADPGRGAALEFLLTLLRVRRREGIEPQIVALSAVIGDTNGLERWLDARLLRRTARPVPLDEGLLCRDGSFRYLAPSGEERIEPCITPRWGEGKSRDWLIPLVQKLVGEGKQVIVFRTSKGETVWCARYLAETLGLPPADDALAALPTSDPSAATATLRTTLASGVAFHNSDLDRDERRVVEEQFRAPDTSLRVVVATTTLAMGVNTPAEAVIIVGLEHPGPGAPQYTVAEYKNMVGRAGRLGHADHGTAYLLAPTARDEDDYWRRYVHGTPEDVSSRFFARSTDPRSLLIRVLATAPRTAPEGLSAEDLIGFVEESFGAFQERAISATWQWDRDHVARALHDLVAHALIESTAYGTFRLTPLGRLAGEAGVEVETIVRLVDALGPVSSSDLKDITLLAATQLAVELDAVLFPLNRQSTVKEPQVWMGELRRQGIPAPILVGFQRTAADQATTTLRAKKAVACILWMSDWAMTRIESTLTQFGGAPGGAAGPIRSVMERSYDILPTVIQVAALLHPDLDVTARQDRLLVRLERGLPTPAVDLALRVRDGLTRGEYLALLRADLCTIEAIAAGTDEALLACLGGDTSKLHALRRAVREPVAEEITLDLPLFE